jgi:23S rRNA (adenine2503-C2)-methyltransferase
MIKKNLCGLTVEEIYALIRDEGYNRPQAFRVADGIYKKNFSDISQIQGIPKRLKTYLDGIADTGIYAPVSSEISSDSTVKYLFISPAGRKFESVWMPDAKRKTVCVSTQSGCRMGCPFCVTGQYGFHGNLSAGDIVNQVINTPKTDKVTHVVFMGMGEPMDNVGNVLKACEILTSEWGMALSSRNITVSSVGITPGIVDFLNKSLCNLTISLYSPFREERVKVIPAESRYPVHEIISIMKAFPIKKKRRFSAAYIMIDGVNDTDKHLEGLKGLLEGSGIRVNLMPYHPAVDDISVSSSDERMLFFKHELIMTGISASIRKSRGADIAAACGLLASGLLPMGKTNC